MPSRTIARSCRTRALGAALAAVALAATVCGDPSTAAGKGGRLTAVTTVSPITSIVSTIAGTRSKDYGWTVLGAVQPRDFEDPTPKEVAALIEQVRAKRVPTIFGSEVFPSKVLEQIGRESGARYEATLRDDDLPGKPQHSWLG